MKKGLPMLILSGILSAQCDAQFIDSIAVRAQANLEAYGPSFAFAKGLRKSAAMSERVLAEVYPPSGDSIVFHHNGNHYTPFDNNSLRYITSGVDMTRWIYKPLDLMTVRPPFKAHDTASRIAQFDVLDRYTSFDPDYQITVPYKFLAFKVVHQYDTKGALTYSNHKSFDSRANVFTFYEQRASYNRNKLEALLTTQYSRNITYQSDDRIAVDSTAALFFTPPRAMNRSTYLYDGSDNWTHCYTATYSLNDTFSQINTFYPDGKLRTSKHYRGTVLNRVDSFAYTPGIPGHSGFWEEVYNGSHVEAYQELCIRVNADSLKDSIVFTTRRDTTIYPSGAYVIRFNAQGNPVSKTVVALNGSGVRQEIMRWYYEPYDPSLDATNPSAKQSTVTLMPNPTSGQLKLNWGGNIPNGPVVINVINSVGQLVYTNNLTPQANSTSTIIEFSKEAAPGVYNVSVLNKAQSTIFKGTFLKQ